ncbi:hypothetical protein M5X11_38740 [Paenibacillus alginolyticus]|uniref:Uncharacterized protein n=1 Tax=Paenibacillus alginolyticus TaxID=59839 RepID=A0ABT4GNS9_9BACL|nr:hypothetical protein [Paenibacillus alginolyticus]MCY9670761.1 hypothetical protein [Paenibacillus alginolyticus]MCY9697876.1 hypothetical protein [Paenibacillus alginolyticus]MEC0145704.1 hypothetical protein [Paenibacillus alginolyticus]
MFLHHFKHKWQWTILVWIILGLFVFPLTPPISHHYSFDTDIIVLANTTPALTVQDHPPSKETIRAQEDMIQRHEDYDKQYEMTVFVVFIIFILSKIWERLKSILLAFLKFISGYTGLIPSLFTRTQLNEMWKRGTLHVKPIGWS